MPLISSSHARERICLMGGFGTGKSTAHERLWYWLAATQSPGTMYVADTDGAVDRAADVLGDAYTQSIVRQQVWEWEDFQVVKQWRPQAGPDDWLVVDRIEKAWQYVQDWYVNEIWGQDSAEFFLEYKRQQAASNKAGGTPLADAHGSNWDVINKNYRRWMMEVVRWPGHVLVCTDVKAVDRGSDDPTTIQMFGQYGRPAGQKDLGKEFHTILLMSQPMVGQWAMTTVRDRNRGVLVGQGVTDWPADYLINVAGWRY